MKKRVRFNLIFPIQHSNHFSLWLAIATILANAPNMYFVFFSFSSIPTPYRETQALFISAILCFALLFCVIRKLISESFVFGIFEFGVSIYYYLIVSHLTGWAILPALGFSFMLPYTLVTYTRQIKLLKIKEDKRRGITKEELTQKLIDKASL